MDKSFLDFWHQFLRNTIAGPPRLEELARWMQQGFSGSDQLGAMFKKAYGLAEMSEDLPDYERHAGEAARAFQRSLEAFLATLGMVPLETHTATLKENEALRQKLAAQEVLIEQLRARLGKTGGSGETSVEQFQEMLASQNEQFQDLMKSFGQFFKPD
jgi:hypothetical protein